MDVPSGSNFVQDGDSTDEQQVRDDQLQLEAAPGQSFSRSGRTIKRKRICDNCGDCLSDDPNNLCAKKKVTPSLEEAVTDDVNDSTSNNNEPEEAVTDDVNDSTSNNNEPEEDNSVQLCHNSKMLIINEADANENVTKKFKLASNNKEQTIVPQEERSSRNSSESSVHSQLNEPKISWSAPSSSKAEQAIATSSKAEPIPTTSKAEPAILSTSNAEPASTSKSEPAIPSTSKAEPIPTTFKAEPAIIPSTSKAEPAIPSTSKAEPAIPSTSKAEPAIPSTSKAEPASEEPKTYPVCFRAGGPVRISAEAYNAIISGQCYFVNSGGFLIELRDLLPDKNGVGKRKSERALTKKIICKCCTPSDTDTQSISPSGCGSKRAKVSVPARSRSSEHQTDTEQDVQRRTSSRVSVKKRCHCSHPCISNDQLLDEPIASTSSQADEINIPNQRRSLSLPSVNAEPNYRELMNRSECYVLLERVNINALQAINQTERRHSRDISVDSQIPTDTGTDTGSQFINRTECHVVLERLKSITTDSIQATQPIERRSSTDLSVGPRIPTDTNSQSLNINNNCSVVLERLKPIATDSTKGQAATTTLEKEKKATKLHSPAVNQQSKCAKRSAASKNIIAKVAKYKNQSSVPFFEVKLRPNAQIPTSTRKKITVVESTGVKRLKSKTYSQPKWPTIPWRKRLPLDNKYLAAAQRRINEYIIYTAMRSPCFVRLERLKFPIIANPEEIESQKAEDNGPNDLPIESLPSTSYEHSAELSTIQKIKPQEVEDNGSNGSPIEPVASSLHSAELSPIQEIKPQEAKDNGFNDSPIESVSSTSSEHSAELSTIQEIKPQEVEDYYSPLELFPSKSYVHSAEISTIQEIKPQEVEEYYSPLVLSPSESYVHSAEISTIQEIEPQEAENDSPIEPVASSLHSAELSPIQEIKPQEAEDNGFNDTPIESVSSTSSEHSAELSTIQEIKPQEVEDNGHNDSLIEPIPSTSYEHSAELSTIQEIKPQKVEDNGHNDSLIEPIPSTSYEHSAELSTIQEIKPQEVEDNGHNDSLIEPIPSTSYEHSAELSTIQEIKPQEVEDDGHNDSLIESIPPKSYVHSAELSTIQEIKPQEVEDDGHNDSLIEPIPSTSYEHSAELSTIQEIKPQEVEDDGHNDSLIEPIPSTSYEHSAELSTIQEIKPQEVEDDGHNDSLIEPIPSTSYEHSAELSTIQEIKPQEVEDNGHNDSLIEPIPSTSYEHSAELSTIQEIKPQEVEDNGHNDSLIEPIPSTSYEHSAELSTIQEIKPQEVEDDGHNDSLIEPIPSTSYEHSAEFSTIQEIKPQEIEDDGHNDSLTEPIPSTSYEHSDELSTIQEIKPQEVEDNGHNDSLIEPIPSTSYEHSDELSTIQEIKLQEVKDNGPNDSPLELFPSKSYEHSAESSTIQEIKPQELGDNRPHDLPIEPIPSTSYAHSDDLWNFQETEAQKFKYTGANGSFTPIPSTSYAHSDDLWNFQEMESQHFRYNGSNDSLIEPIPSTSFAHNDDIWNFHDIVPEEAENSRSYYLHDLPREPVPSTSYGQRADLLAIQEMETEEVEDNGPNDLPLEPVPSTSYAHSSDLSTIHNSYYCPFPYIHDYIEESSDDDDDVQQIFPQDNFLYEEPAAIDSMSTQDSTNSEENDASTQSSNKDEDASTNYEFQLQNMDCIALSNTYPGLIMCCDCIAVFEFGASEDYSCRFLNFRKFKRDSTDRDNMKISFPPTPEEGPQDPSIIKIAVNSYKRKVVLKEIMYKANHLFPHLLRILKEEYLLSFDVNPECIREFTGGYRDLCDCCCTSIFNRHWICKHCGYLICLLCFKDLVLCLRQNKRSRFDCEICITGEKHEICDLVLCEIIPKSELRHLMEKISSFEHILIDEHQREKAKDRKAPVTVEPNRSPSTWTIDSCKADKFRAPYDLISGDRVMRLMLPYHRRNVKLFQKFWAEGIPVVISGLENRIRKSIWNPKSFTNDLADDDVCDVIDCRSSKSFTVDLKDFWGGFSNDRVKKIDPKNGLPYSFKIKDFPTTADLKDVFPERFDDFYNTVPVPSYTKRTGFMNLAGNLPESYVRPDLGPKLYVAYSAIDDSNYEFSSTNLHLDLTDAVNVMMFAKDKPSEKNTLRLHAELENLDVMEDYLCRTIQDEILGKPTPPNVGAIWHIFHAKDTEKIRDLLRKVSKEQKRSLLPDQDPIHKQTWYIDAKLRKRLKEEYDVVGYNILQFVGDAVFIPAGAAHQVRNLKDSVKIATDFFSVENLSSTISLIEEFRNEAFIQSGSEDKLQVYNTLYHAAKDCVQSIDDYLKANSYKKKKDLVKS